MTQVPASSHGGGTFNGGTITEPLVIDLTADVADRTALDVLQPATFGFGVRPFRFRQTDFAYLQMETTGTVSTTGNRFSTAGGHGTFSGGISASRITSGALPTVAPASGTAFQASLSNDAFLVVPVTYNPGAATTATCLVELSPDDVTYSTLVTITKPAGTVFDGMVEPLCLHIPTGWYVKLTVTNAVLGTGTVWT